MEVLTLWQQKLAIILAQESTSSLMSELLR